MTEEEFARLSDFEWMPSRIPLRNALTALIPPGSGEFPKEKLPPGKSRWYPQEDGGLRLRVPYLGQSFDAEIFEVRTGRLGPYDVRRLCEATPVDDALLRHTGRPVHRTLHRML